MNSPTSTKPLSAVLNVAAYRFVALDELPVLRDRLLTVCRTERLRGTILLASEGINLVVAGAADGMAALRGVLDSDERLAGLDFKESWSRDVPFKRLKVKIKNEVIAFGIAGIDPARDPAPALSPQTLRSWLDGGRDVVLLDARNAYEVAHGSFRGARHLGNDTFRGFAEAAAALPVNDSETPVVTFCTGGIRCEKAAPLLRKLGHRNVYQLSGGILRYLELVGPEHYEGTCFVFDERVGLDPDLSPQNIEQL